MWGQARRPKGRMPWTHVPGGQGRPWVPTSRRETSMSTAKLAVWLHWQVTWVRFRASSSQPLADQPPVPPGLRRKGGVGPSSAGLPACRTLAAPTSARHPEAHSPLPSLRPLLSARSRCVIAVKLKWTLARPLVWETLVGC